MDAVIHMADAAHHRLRRRPARGAGGDVRRQLQRGRGGAARPACSKVRRRLVGVDLRPGRHLPDARGPSPVQQPHLVRREQDHARRPAALVQRHVRPALRGAALLQRVRPAHGHPRQVHRGADPLDGAHRRRPAAADPRRRHDQTMDFVYIDDVARANVLALESDVERRRVQRRQRHRDQPATSSPPRCCRSWAPTARSPSTARSAAVNPVPRRLASTTQGARSCSASVAQVGLDEGLRRLVDWWHASQDRTAAIA